MLPWIHLECIDASSSNQVRECVPVLSQDTVSGMLTKPPSPHCHSIPPTGVQMVEILRKAMKLKTKSEALLQAETTDEEPSGLVGSPLETILALNCEVDVLVDQCKEQVKHHHLFAEIPTSRRQYQ